MSIVTYRLFVFKEPIPYIFVSTICSSVVLNEFRLRKHTTEYNNLWEISYGIQQQLTESICIVADNDIHNNKGLFIK